MLRRFPLALLLVVLAVPAWFLLGIWLPGGSERCYLLLPPLFVGIYAALAPDGWRGLRAHVRPALRYLAALTLFSTVCYLFLIGAILPGGAGMIWRGFHLPELLRTLYFLVAVSLVVTVPLALLKWLCHSGADRLLGTRVDGVPSPPLRATGQMFLREIMPAILLVPVLLPYLLGAMYVHRLKIPNPASPRELLGRDYEDVSFVTEDGLTIRGWFMPALPGPSTRTLLICHGLGANRSNFLHYHGVGDVLGANVLLFDFRGHGDSDGHTVSFGHHEKRDVLAAAAFLRTHKPEQAQQLYALGISMGSASLVLAAAEIEPPFDAVILDSPFATAVELTDQILSGFPAFTRPLLALPGVPIASLHAGCSMEEVRPIDRIADIRAPLLIIHAKGDRLIPVAHAERLYEAAVQPKLLWLADTGMHGSAYQNREEYLRRVRRISNAEFRMSQ